MKVAVVGGNGFIGKEFVSYAIEKGHIPVVIGSSNNVFCDDGYERVKELLKDCDALVLLAAKRISSSFSIKDYFYNIELAGKYFELCKDLGINNLVTTSSQSVYSSDKLPWKENDFDQPLSLYGASKQAIDSLALTYNRNVGMKIKSLRLAQVLGMGERKGYLLNTLIDNALAKKKQIIFGKGNGRRQYIYLKDVCNAIMHSLIEEKNNEGIFNIAMADNVSIAELAEIINSVFDNPNGIEFKEYDKEDTKEYLMDISKARDALHWIAKYDLNNALLDIRNDVDKDLKQI